MSKKCVAYSESKLGLESTDNRKAFYAGWDAAEKEVEEEVKKLHAEIHQITHQLYDYRAAFMRARDREWVGLTDEEIDLYAFDEGVTDNKAPAWLVTYARGIEAKLKEKNHG
jgi:hypothetical protein